MGTFEDNNIPVSRDHGHDVMETIKIHVVLDGDLAATINNLALYAMQQNVLDEIIFCGHTAPKLAALLKTIQEKLDIDNRVEPSPIISPNLDNLTDHGLHAALLAWKAGDLTMVELKKAIKMWSKQ